MNKKAAHVLQGFLSLSDDDKKEVIKQIEEYKKYPYTTKEIIQKSINESFESNSISLGPSPNSCPCCGK
jgi:hypothetical protein